MPDKVSVLPLAHAGLFVFLNINHDIFKYIEKDDIMMQFGQSSVHTIKFHNRKDLLEEQIADQSRYSILGSPTSVSSRCLLLTRCVILSFFCVLDMKRNTACGSGHETKA